MKVTNLVAAAALAAAAAGPSLSQDNPGKAGYEAHCAVCHQYDGGGVPFMQPELFARPRANGPKGGVIDMIMLGSKAPGAGQGEYSNEMPGFDFLSNEEIAAIATYVRTNFENNGGPVTADDVKSRR
ncbi:MAG: cytochrome c [Kordiimonadaceae bacterium]|nr:cytochrome c [Kordiimonadaceae bacterium]MBO6569669.1 cytochrome c [Kordiimonadaceae bacterium]MBO6966204.1 cytochrome c [Kordiimonadaceae bacterium]